MKTKHLFLLIPIFYLLVFSGHALMLHKTVYGDGIYYYSWVRSILIDHDISFINDYARLGGDQPITPLKLMGNVYPVGPAIFWFPFFTWGQWVIRGDGFAFPYQFLIGLISSLYAITGLIILYRLLLKYFSEKISLVTILGIALGTNLLFYGAVDTVNSHALSFFVSTVLLTFVLEKRSFVLIGFFTGLLSLMRTQDAIFLLLALPLLFENFLSDKKVMQKLFRLTAYSLLLATSFLIGFIPQLLAWQLLYGTFMKSPYLDRYHYFDFFHPQLFNVLFSPNNGLILWTPLILLCLIGLLLKSKIIQSYRNIFLLIILIQWYLIASWSFWWEGASFSGRMFISLLPFLAFGLATVCSLLNKKVGLILVGGCSVLTLALIGYYLLNH